MPIHNFVDNIVNSTTLFVNSATPPGSKVYLDSVSFLLFEKEVPQTSLISNAVHSYTVAETSLLSRFASATNELCLDSVSIYVAPFTSQSSASYFYKPNVTYLKTSFGKFSANLSSGNSTRTTHDDTSIFVKNAQDQELAWFVSTNLLENTEVEIADTPDDNGGGQSTTGLKEFWA